MNSSESCSGDHLKKLPVGEEISADGYDINAELVAVGKLFPRGSSSSVQASNTAFVQAMIM